MAWLRRLLGMIEDDARPVGAASRAAAPKNAVSRVEGDQARQVSIERHGDRIVGVPEIDFIGECAISSNGRFTLLWSDRTWSNGNLVSGRYALIDGDRVIIDRSMARPQDGKVTDDGICILNDWGATENLCGTFHAYGADGRPLVEASFAANLYNNGLSPDGRIAVCQTCSAPDSSDGSVLCVFDLVAGAEISRWTPQSGWAEGYEFPAEGDRIRMTRRGREPIAYSLHGEFIDQRLWFADEVGLGTLHVIREALRLGGAATGLTLEDLRSGVGVALAGDDRRLKADALRLRGEIEEEAGNPAAALETYREALELNPRIGVAKRAATLAKSLEQPPSR